MAIHEMWIEEYSCTGNNGTAKHLATVEADTFREACFKFSSTEGASGYGDFNKERLTFWGCRLFSNEEDARKSFG